MTLFGYTIPEIRKFLVALAGTLVILLNSALEEFAPFLPDPVPSIITYVAAVLTAVGVFLVRNAELIDSAGDDSQ